MPSLRTGMESGEKESLRTGLDCKDPSLARQSERDQADINSIVRQFGLTGQLPSNVRVPLQEDFVDLLSFHDAQNAIRAAEESFNRMPAAVRARFDNDPGLFVEFCSKEENLDEMAKMGLAVKDLEPPEEAAKPPEAAPEG